MGLVLLKNYCVPLNSLSL